jgi:hypothetical protein
VTARVFRSQRAARTVGSIARSVTPVVVRAIAADVVPKAFTAEAPTMLHTMTSANVKPPQPPPHRRDQKAPNLPRSSCVGSLWSARELSGRGGTAPKMRNRFFPNIENAAKTQQDCKPFQLAVTDLPSCWDLTQE